MSKKKSRMSTRGGSLIGWDSIDLFGTHRKAYKHHRGVLHQQRLDNVAHAKDERRQYVEQGTSWDFVHVLLKGTKGLSLTDAKRIAGTLIK